MKVSFTDLLGETQEIFSEQPSEVRQAMEDVSNFVIDVNVKTVIDYLSDYQAQYVTYSHS